MLMQDWNTRIFRLEEYDVVDGKWNFLAHVPLKHQLMYPALTSFENDIYLIGGRDIYGDPFIAIV